MSYPDPHLTLRIPEIDLCQGLSASLPVITNLDELDGCVVERTTGREGVAGVVAIQGDAGLVTQRVDRVVSAAGTNFGRFLLKCSLKIVWKIIYLVFLNFFFLIISLAISRLFRIQVVNFFREKERKSILPVQPSEYL